MTIINPNSIAGITSVTAQADIINFYKSDGNQAGLGLNGVNFNTTAGISTFNNLVVGGVLTYEDVKNVDSIGIITARNAIHVNSASPYVKLTDTDNNGVVNIKNIGGVGVVTTSSDVKLYVNISPSNMEVSGIDDKYGGSEIGIILRLIIPPEEVYWLSLAVYSILSIPLKSANGV